MRALAVAKYEAGHNFGEMLRKQERGMEASAAAWRSVNVCTSENACALSLLRQVNV